MSVAGVVVLLVALATPACDDDNKRCNALDYYPELGRITATLLRSRNTNPLARELLYNTAEAVHVWKCYTGLGPVVPIYSIVDWDCARYLHTVGCSTFQVGPSLFDDSTPRKCRGMY